MLVLLPPSETKAYGGTGAPLDLGTLSFPTLTATRRTLVRDLVRLAKRQTHALQQALAVSDAQRAEVLKNRDLLTAPTIRVSDLYTGVVYDTLSYATLSPAARRRADQSLVVSSALFGLLQPQDHVPSYRLSGGTVLPGLGGLAARWRPVLEPLLADEVVIDLRSGAYAKLARVPHAIEVRVLREQDGRRTVVSHDNKWTKGKLARALCDSPVRDVIALAEIARTVCDDVIVEDGRLDLVLHGLASRRSELAQQASDGRAVVASARGD